MMNKNIINPYEIILDIDSLDPLDAQALVSAKEGLEKSYAPYSNFNVGAAILAGDKIYLGANQENASYPLCMCAERVALYNYAMHESNLPATHLGIVVRNPNNPVTKPGTPCGACRQVILEYELRQKADIRLILQGESGEIWILPSVKTLLPLYFDPDLL